MNDNKKPAILMSLDDAKKKVATMTKEEREHYAAYGYRYFQIVSNGMDDSTLRRLIKISE